MLENPVELWLGNTALISTKSENNFENVITRSNQMKLTGNLNTISAKLIETLFPKKLKNVAKNIRRVATYMLPHNTEHVAKAT